jgi:hypothetical protein
VPHNIHVFKGKDASGESVGMSPLNAGPIDDTLRLPSRRANTSSSAMSTPTTMAGKLTVT